MKVFTQNVERAKDVACAFFFAYAVLLTVSLLGVLSSKEKNSETSAPHANAESAFVAANPEAKVLKVEHYRDGNTERWSMVEMLYVEGVNTGDRARLKGLDDFTGNRFGRNIFVEGDVVKLFKDPLHPRAPVEIRRKVDAEKK